MRNRTRPAVALNILAEAARSGVSQQELGEQVGLSQAAMSRRLSGDVAFRLDELQVIAPFLRVTVEQLLAPIAEEVSA